MCLCAETRNLGLQQTCSLTPVSMWVCILWIFGCSEADFTLELLLALHLLSSLSLFLSLSLNKNELCFFCKHTHPILHQLRLIFISLSLHKLPHCDFYYKFSSFINILYLITNQIKMKGFKISGMNSCEKEGMSPQREKGNLTII